MYLHIHYLTIGMAGWRDYLNYLALRLKKLNEEIAIYKPYSEFGISFASKQNIHNLRQKLHHARSILANTLNTLTTIRIHEEQVAKYRNLPVFIHQSFKCELRIIFNDLKNHQQTTEKLLSSSNDTESMYDDILKFHGQELLHSNTLKLAQIAQNDSQETQTMATLANKTYQDSRTTRIATVIAMFYLPANLVLVIIFQHYSGMV
ncbi:hypothetical protein F5X96DRAFT_66275 [Biscogniauxia mediterranea]|nr:hypothetical protein F5X96DRAFT_66275 [Biscogniauxia mediterranea]